MYPSLLVRRSYLSVLLNKSPSSLKIKHFFDVFQILCHFQYLLMILVGTKLIFLLIKCVSHSDFLDRKRKLFPDYLVLTFASFVSKFLSIMAFIFLNSQRWTKGVFEWLDFILITGFEIDHILALKLDFPKPSYFALWPLSASFGMQDTFDRMLDTF